MGVFNKSDKGSTPNGATVIAQGTCIIGGISTKGTVHIDGKFEGVIATVTNFGMFVRLTELHIEGLVHINSLGKEYYQYDERRMRLTGEQTGVRYHVGDRLKVKVAAVNLDEKKIDLVLVDKIANATNKIRLPAAKKKTAKTKKRDVVKGEQTKKPKAKKPKAKVKKAEKKSKHKSKVNKSKKKVNKAAKPSG